jgi:hypothetical protein
MSDMKTVTPVASLSGTTCGETITENTPVDLPVVIADHMIANGQVVEGAVDLTALLAAEREKALTSDLDDALGEHVALGGDNGDASSKTSSDDGKPNAAKTRSGKGSDGKPAGDSKA